MRYVVSIIGILLVFGITYVVWILRKASKLDLIHYPDRGIDMCKYCLYEYQSRYLEDMLRDIEQAARMNINISKEIWNRFCCDALRNKLKAKYGIVASHVFSNDGKN